MVTPFQAPTARSADHQYSALPSVPVRVDFEARRVAQSATRPGLSAGLGTAVPLEHCSVYWAGMAGGVGAAGGVGGAGGAGAAGAGGTARSDALNAVASDAPASRARAMKDARAIRARAAMGLGLWKLRGAEGLRRAESRRRNEEAAALPRVDEGRASAFSLEHMAGGGILSIGVGCCGELFHKLSSLAESQSDLGVGIITTHS